MDLTPQSMRSPVSPFNDEPKHSFNTLSNGYAPAPQTEHSSMAESSRGLGIFCGIPSQDNIVQDLPPSPQQSEHWTQQSPMVNHDFYPHPQSGSAPNINTAAFDPFSGFDSAPTGNLMSAPEEAPELIYCSTPPSTNMPSHRSSISSSCSPSPQQGFYTPRVKSEDIHEWYPSPGNDQILHRSLSSQSYTPYSTTVTSMNGTTEDLFKSPSVDWSKGGVPTHFSALTSRDSHPRFEPAPVLPSANRIKKKRQRTTPEEATHNCRVCGKLFKRSYNWKSHMETHNPDRKYPHPCTASIDDQPCSKKFQRKTDLDRHYESVHLKARNHHCELCGHRFARRDTLRRHTEDGCPKRFDLASSPAPRWNGPARSFTAPSASTSMPPPPTGLGLHHPLPPPSAHPPSQPYFPRTDFVHSPLQTSQSIFA